ncbi:MAG: HAMP domain-containing histidine kinase [Clostridia bacterium]|nr:HAMP domain-containing histidine kinase [Clostridia bacterium]
MTVLLAFFNVSIINLVERSLVNRRVNELRVEVETAAATIAPEFALYDAQDIYDYICLVSENNNARILVADANGIVQADAFSQVNATKLWFTEVEDVLSGSEFSYGFHEHVIEGKDGEQSQWLIYCVAPMIYDGSRIGVVLYSQSVQDVVDMLALISKNMRINSIGVGILVILMSFFVASYTLNPVEELTDSIEAMSLERVVHPVAIEAGGHSEIARLAAAFNGMTRKMEATDRARNEFVSNASHELKTPLTSMKVLTQSLLQSEHFDEELTREFLGDIDHEIDRLTLLVSDLLLLTRIDKQDSTVTFEQVNLGDVMERALRNLVPLAKTKDIIMEADINAECVVSGDDMRLFQMVTNLTDNAIKYTPEGGTVHVYLDMQDDEAILRVKDSGIGIPADALEHIFDRFYRVDRARARDAGGNGLGLSIVYQIIQMHQGTIDVQSVENAGTTFTVRLPLAITEQVQQQEAQE